MIALLKGIIHSKNDTEIILDVNGVGYQVLLAKNTLDQLPEPTQELTLHIYTHVREDAFVLYGFFTKEEKDIFIKLLKVNGIGPKLALSILSGVGPQDFVNAVYDQDLKRLNAIPGVGKKTAERIIIDLKDKLLGFKSSQPIFLSKKANKTFDDAESALLNLGYNKLHVERVLSKTTFDETTSLSIIIKQALKELAEL